MDLLHHGVTTWSSHPFGISRKAGFIVAMQQLWDPSLTLPFAAKWPLLSEAITITKILRDSTALTLLFEHYSIISFIFLNDNINLQK